MNTNGHFNNAINPFLKELNEFDKEKCYGTLHISCSALSKSCYTIRSVWNSLKEDEKLHHWYLLYVLQPDLQRAVSHIASVSGCADDAIFLVNLSYLSKGNFEVHEKMECVSSSPEQLETFVFYTRTARAILREMQVSLNKTKDTRLAHRIELKQLLKQTGLFWKSFTHKQQQFYIELVMLFTPQARSIATEIRVECPVDLDFADSLCSSISELESCNGRKSSSGCKRQRV